ncbi:hypothetical protein FA15DRAFT_582328, partial [Coprinopsis marcescibilis]
SSDTSTRTCAPCNMVFATIMLLETHRRQNHHWCFICSRDFKSQGALRAHSRSLAHVNRHIPCRVSGCEKHLKSPSGVAHHLESNVHNHIHRNAVTAAAQTIDIIPAISLKNRIAGDGIGTAPATVTSYVATAAAWNGKHFECFLCHRGFKELQSLNQHLNSASHDGDEFKCPNAKCGRSFTLISGFVQHLESRSCKLADIKRIQEHFNDLAAQVDRMLKL